MIKVSLKSYNSKLLNKFYEDFSSTFSGNLRIISHLTWLPSSLKHFSIIKSPHVHGRYSKENYTMKVFKTSFRVGPLSKKDAFLFLNAIKQYNEGGLGIRLDFEI